MAQWQTINTVVVMPDAHDFRERRRVIQRLLPEKEWFTPLQTSACGSYCTPEMGAVQEWIEAAQQCDVISAGQWKVIDVGSICIYEKECQTYLTLITSYRLELDQRKF
jgi:hypothetical protein